LYPTLTYFLIRCVDKNIQNIAQKARKKRDFMLRLLFMETPIEFTVDDEDIASLYAHGVIDNIDGYVGVPVSLVPQTTDYRLSSEDQWRSRTLFFGARNRE
jgi:hypothetical protein